MERYLIIKYYFFDFDFEIRMALKNEQEKVIYLCSLAQSAYHVSGSKEWFEFYLQGASVCIVTLALVMLLLTIIVTNQTTQILGIRRKKLIVAVNSRSSTVLIHGNSGKQSVRLPTVICASWISWYSEQVADHCPRSQKLYIPHCYTRSDLYRIYLDNVRATPDAATIINIKWFCRVLKKQFTHLHMASKVQLGFCDECIKLTEARLKATTEEEKASYRHAQTLHFELQRAERVAYQR